MFGAARLARGIASVAGVGLALIRPPSTRTFTLPSPGAFARAAGEVAREAVGLGPVRRCSTGSERIWLEVHGMHGPLGADLVDEVRTALRAIPGVRDAEVHRPWQRVVVTTDPDASSREATIRVVEEVERRFPADDAGARPVDLPGDDGLLARRVIAAGASVTGLGVCLAGRFLQLPRFATVLPAPIVALDYQPRLRPVIESTVGPEAADLVFSVLTAATYTLAQAPSSLAVEAAVRVAEIAETLAVRRAWSELEPEFAAQAATATGPPGPCRPAPNSTGPSERYADRAALAAAATVGILGAGLRNPLAAGNAAIVAAPKAARSTHALFAATLGRGLPDAGVLPAASSALHALDRVDALVIDPRVLYTSTLSVTRLEGVRGRDRAEVWVRAQEAVTSGDLRSGWHAVHSLSGFSRDSPGRVLVGPIHDGYASVLLAEARRAGVEVVSVDDRALRSLRVAFDRLQPLSESIDRTLQDAVEDLRDDGRIVAVIATDAPFALAAADVGIGVLVPGRERPWGAHLMADDLAGVWRVVHALPAARAASRRGIMLSLNASVLGSLLMVPGVPGRGPEAVTAAAAIGLWAGFSAARRVLADPEPEPEPGYDWHALPVGEVTRILPFPNHVETRPSGTRTRVAMPAGLRSVVRAGAAPWEFARALRGELSDPLTPVLATCATASALLGSPTDAVLVGSVLVLNAAISATQRLRAESVLKALLSQQDPAARRAAGPSPADGFTEVESSLLMPGDVVEVRPGEVAPADGRLVSASGVEVDESLLTGESLPVVKQTEPTPGAPLAERTCMLYAGTTVLTGTAIAVVTSVGSATETRRATAMAPVHVHEVGLQRQLTALTRRALPVSFGGGLLVSVLGLLRGVGIRSAVVSGVSVVVAAVPEGLPLVATLAQTASARRLTASNAVVRTPSSIEALGRVDVVCFDKTGTLSENRLRVKVVEAGAGFDRSQVLSAAARTSFTDDGTPTEHATDIAIVEAAHGTGEHDTLARLPFRPGRSFAAAVSGNVLVVKGAPETMLDACLDDDPVLRERVDRMAGDGLRVIAVGERRLTDEQVADVTARPEELEPLCSEGLRLIGLLGLSDTPRAEASGLLPALIDQGIEVRLITGDHPVTAIAIAGDLGLPVTEEQVITGTDWEGLSLAEREQAVTDRLVFARMTPEHKVQIVHTLEQSGRVCAMVGDGANDAAAIRTASVGIGVASHGSDPARGAADVVLLDGRIGGLIPALEEGRRLWQRVTAAVAVLLGGNAGEVLFAIIGSLITGRSPLNARQLLLVNMLTDALPAAALALGTPNGNGENARTHGADPAQLMRIVAVRGGATAAGATGAWAVASLTGTRRRASTVALIALVATQLGQTLLDSRSPLVVTTVVGSLVAMALVVNIPVISGLLGCVPVGPVGWAQGLGAAALATAAAAFAPELVRRFSESGHAAWAP